MATFDFCTLPQLKEELRIDSTTTEDDDLLALIIAAVSKDAETYLERTILTGTYTEYFDVEIHDQLFSLNAYPVTSITGVWNDADWDFGSSTAVGSSWYHMNPVHDALFIDRYVLISGHQALKVTYVGGMADETSTFQSKYPHLARACIRQCAYQFRSGRYLGANSVNTQMGNVSLLVVEDFLPEVKAVLNKHRRRCL